MEPSYVGNLMCGMLTAVLDLPSSGMQSFDGDIRDNAQETVTFPGHNSDHYADES